MVRQDNPDWWTVLCLGDWSVAQRPAGGLAPPRPRGRLHDECAAIKIAVHRIGPALVFERLWEETGCRAVIADLAGKRAHKFALERAVFLTVLHRLFVSGSDRAADRWREDYAIASVI